MGKYFYRVLQCTARLAETLIRNLKFLSFESDTLGLVTVVLLAYPLFSGRLFFMIHNIFLLSKNFPNVPHLKKYISQLLWCVKN
jgi:hypothetical protein